MFHFLVASPSGFDRYINELQHHRNRFRCVEYSLSASLVIVVIAGLTGATDIAALLAIVLGLNASMILFGWLMETMNVLVVRAQCGRTSAALQVGAGHTSASCPVTLE